MAQILSLVPMVLNASQLCATEVVNVCFGPIADIQPVDFASGNFRPSSDCWGQTGAQIRHSPCGTAENAQRL